ncbi:hypothetical protein KSS87_005228 [Heliosperma pusillum]|nr:hypothetical protein KSS87_005228 [Heliosperma pusillum]
MNSKMKGSCKTEGNSEPCAMEENHPNQSHEHDSFIWDENSQLYYHPSYLEVLSFDWVISKVVVTEHHKKAGAENALDCQFTINGQGTSALDESSEQNTGVVDQEKEENEDYIGRSSNEVPENLPPPSEWLEDTLIELYLSGYSAGTSNATETLLPYEQDVDMNSSMLSTDANNALHAQQDSELSSDHEAPTTSSAAVIREEISWEEENWRAQYGQVVQQDDESRPECHVVDIWDWSMNQEVQKDGNYQVARLLGLLVKPSSSLHPSITSHGRRFKTAPICRVHLDLVQVRSGQVYKLRSPNVRYLATLSSYDASNPTKGWGFPELSNEDTREGLDATTPCQLSSSQNESSFIDRPSTSKKSLFIASNGFNPLVVEVEQKACIYRDRAAERRTFHKEFGEAMGDESSDEVAGSSECPEKAAAEALEMSLGAGSYAQKILKNMGWKEGEGLGKSQQGMREPLQGTANKGTAGLGWPFGRTL